MTLDENTQKIWERVMDHDPLDITKGAIYLAELKSSGNNRGYLMCSIYHFSLWLDEHPDAQYAILIDGMATKSPIFNVSAYSVFVAFDDQALRDNFRTWLKDYETWFKYNEKPLEQCYYPAMPVKGSHTLHFVTCDTGFGDGLAEMIQPTIFERWSWIKANCNSPVYVGWGFLAFTDKKEGALYRIHYD